MMSPVRLSVSPSGESNRKIGATIMTSGNIWLTSMRPTIQNFPRNAKREKP